MITDSDNGLEDSDDDVSGVAQEKSTTTSTTAAIGQKRQKQRKVAFERKKSRNQRSINVLICFSLDLCLRVIADRFWR